MAEWLILQLSRGLEERCGWMLADERGQALSAPRVGALAQAAGDAGGRRIAAVVPSSDVLMTEVELPQKSGVRPQQIAPFALVGVVLARRPSRRSPASRPRPSRLRPRLRLSPSTQRPRRSRRSTSRLWASSKPLLRNPRLSSPLQSSPLQ